MPLGTRLSFRETFDMMRAELDRQSPAPPRVLKNASSRADIRADFPLSLDAYKPKTFSAVIESELQKCGLDFSTAQRINIAYPHKDPAKFQNYYNGAEEYARKFQAEMKKQYPHIEWPLATGICESVHLARSEDRSSLHALTGRQYHTFRAEEQCDTFPFATQHGREIFIIADQFIEQGTTVASLMSYIHANNGHVLAAVSGGSPVAIAQQNVSDVTISLSGAFNDSARNTARLPQLADTFCRSAQKAELSLTPQECLEKFDQELRRYGNSVFALTDGECSRINGTINGTYAPKGGTAALPVSFPTFIDNLRKPRWARRV